MQFYIYYILDFYKGINKFNKNLELSEPFKNLFTQGMVCHESYKISRENGYPDEVEKIDQETFKKKDKSKVTVGPPESMSKSKKYSRPRNNDCSIWC